MTSFHHLPTEILCHVLSRFDTADILGGCMLVSKTWHTRLVQCAPLWIHVKSEKEQFSPKALLPMAHHIQKLDILDHHHSWLQLLFDDIKQGVFTNLKHLKLNLPFDHSIDLYNGLSILGDTLTTLNISLRDPALSLASVMNACPNLRCLEFNSPFWYGNHDDLDIYPTNKLKALKLDNYSTRPLSRNQLIWMLSRLGNGLRVLNVPVCDRDVDVVELCCPSLHTLTCGAYVIVPAHDITEETLSLDDIEDDNNNNSGLRHLTMAPQDLRLFLRLMRKHSDTLETMQLWLNTPLYGGNIYSESGRIIRHLQLNRLNSLSIITVPGFRMDRFLEMMRGMCRSSLHKLYLHGDRSIPSPSLPDMLHLHCLRLCQLQETIDHQMTSYFTRLASMGDSCPITTIEMYDVAFTDHTLSLLARIQTLQCIKFVSGPTDSWTENGIVDFFISTQSSLRTVGLFLPQITDSMLDALSALPSIKKLLLAKKLPLERMDRFKKTYPGIQVITLDRKEYHLCCCAL